MTMIALNREMPRRCLDCPCMSTFIFEKDNLAARVCMASFVGILYKCKLDETVSNEWMDFPKPSNCPWIDMSESSYDKEFEREWLQEKLSDLEDGDTFGY